MNYRLAQYRITQGTAFAVVVLDEGHYIKNYEAKRTEAVFGLKAWIRWTLTGTPILNRPAELYTLLHWLDPIGWPRKWDFYKKFCGAVRGYRGWDISGASNLELLGTRLKRTILIRRKKADVLTQLPPKRYQILERETSTDVRAVDRACLRSTKGVVLGLEELGKLPLDEFFHWLGRLRFVGAGPGAEHVATARRLLGIEKLPWAVDEIREYLAVEEPLVVWAWHREVLQALKDTFPAAAIVTGSTPARARQKAVEAFQTGQTPLFLGQIQAAGQGITLTRASTALFVEIDWVPANLTQAEDRIHRIGQKNPCLYKFLVWAGSLDALVLRRVREKQEIINAVWR